MIFGLFLYCGGYCNYRSDRRGKEADTFGSADTFGTQKGTASFDPLGLKIDVLSP